MRGTRFHLSLLVTIALVATSCGDSTSTATTTTTTTDATASTSTSTTVPESTTTTLPPDASAALDLPRSGTYAHVEFTIDDATFSNRTPGTYFEEEPDLGEERHLFVDFTVGFEEGFPGVSEDFSIDDFSLVLGDGTEIVAGRVDFKGQLFVTDDGPESWAFAFPGADFDLEGATLQYDDDTHVPLEIPLTGTPPEDPYPVVFPLEGFGDVEYEGGCAAATGSVSLLEAAWDLDGGVDHDGDPIIGSLPARALDGEHFVRITVQSIAAAGTCGGTVFDDAAFRLIIDGLPVGTENSFVTLLEDGEGIEVVLAFRVPNDTEEAILEVGIPDGLTASFEIDVLPLG